MQALPWHSERDAAVRGTGASSVARSARRQPGMTPEPKPVTNLMLQTLPIAMAVAFTVLLALAVSGASDRPAKGANPGLSPVAWPAPAPAPAPFNP